MGQQKNINEDERDLVEYIRVIYKHRKMIMALAAVSMLIAGGLSFLQPRMYEASATFFPMNIDYGIQARGLGIKPLISMENLIISIIESRRMQDRIIEQLDLKKVWNMALISDARGTLKASTKITLGSNGLIRLSVKAISAELSAKITNAYIDNLDYFNSELDLGTGRNIIQLIDRAATPEDQMSRGVRKNALAAGAVALMAGIFLSFLAEFAAKSGVWKKIKER